MRNFLYETVFGKEGVIPSEKTYEELRELNFGADFCNQKGEYPYRNLEQDEIPDNLRAVLLEDVLDYLESNGGFDYIIEIKDSGELGEKAADELYRILKEKELIDNVVVGTFNNNVTKYMDEKDNSKSMEIKMYNEENFALIIFTCIVLGPVSIIYFIIILRLRFKKIRLDIKQRKEK